MDPTEAELNAITDLAGVFTWSGVAGGLERSLREALGDPARIRELALVPRPAWDAMASALKVPGPAHADGNAGPPRDLTLVERARVESARRVALLDGHPAGLPGCIWAAACHTGPRAGSSNHGIDGERRRTSPQAVGRAGPHSRR